MLKDHMEISIVMIFILSILVALFAVISLFTEIDYVSTRAENKILKKELCRVEQSDYWCKK